MQLFFFFGNSDGVRRIALGHVSDHRKELWLISIVT